MKNLIFTFIISISTFAFGQTIPNAKTIEVAISGNCGMCETTIEKAANKNGEALLDWDKTTKKAKLTYDAAKTNPKEVLKRVAKVGYDNQFYKGNNDAYNKLPKCCLYSRDAKNALKSNASMGEKSVEKACCSGDEKACDSQILAKADGKSFDMTKKDGKSCCLDHSTATK